MNSIDRRIARLSVKCAMEIRRQEARAERAAREAREAEFSALYPGALPNLEWTHEIQKPRFAKDGYIYFIECQDFIKIGWTRNLEQRLSAIGMAVPFTLRLLHIAAGSKDDERSLHLRFGKHQHKGEWFRKAPELLEFIEERKCIQG
jgi:Meiotically up-regulated gene 113